MDFNWVSNKIIEDRIDTLPYKKKFLSLINELHKSTNIKKMKEVCENIKCGPFGSTVLASSYVGKGVLYVRPVNISENEFDDSDITFLSKEFVKDKNLDLFSENDLFFGRVGNPCVSKVFSISNEITISPNIIGVKVGKKIDSNYLWMFCSSKYGVFQVERMLKIVAQPTTSTEVIKDMDIYIPSLKIQQYIGNKVRKSEELREEVKRLKKEANEYLYSQMCLPYDFQSEISSYGYVPSSYLDNIRLDSTFYYKKYVKLEEILKGKQHVLLDDIIIETKYGASISADYYNEGIPFLRGLNLTENQIIDDDLVYLHKSMDKEIGKNKVNVGDILITRSGTVGICAVIDERFKGYAFGSFMIKLVVKNSEWNPYYVAAFLNSFWGKWQVDRLKNGAVQQNINLQEIGRIIIPKIDGNIQNEIEKKIKEYIQKELKFKNLIKEAKKDVEDLIEGKFDMSKLEDTADGSR